MSRNLKDINTRNFTGSTIPVGSVIGRVLINSEDSGKISNAIRSVIKKGPQTVKLSQTTKKALQIAKSH
mgnify:CR=1 FL=1